MRYMLPGVISLGLFMSAMIGGAILYLDDKQRGVHEGYLVTPITKAELVIAQMLSGTIKASATKRTSVGLPDIEISPRGTHATIMWCVRFPYSQVAAAM